MDKEREHPTTVHTRPVRRKRRKLKKWDLPKMLGLALALVLAAALMIYGLCDLFSPEKEPAETEPTVTETVPVTTEPTEESQVDLSQLPEDLVLLLEKHPEAKDFVLEYPVKKDLEYEIDLSSCLGNDEMPLLIQWDERWGYTEYADELMGLSGCGPTCLSMVCIHLLQDAKYTPRYVAEFATENKYTSSGKGSKWLLISEGGEKLGLDITEIPLVERRIIQNLEAGNPIICVVGPGFFTSTGHYIVMVGYENGYVKIKDPNSLIRSEQLWNLKEVMEQIRNLWVCKLPE